MANIHLIGTIHEDLKGANRLERALQIEKPKILTIETSPEWNAYLTKYWQEDVEKVLEVMKQRGFPLQVYPFFEKLLLTSSYEFNVCEAYSQRARIPLYLIDDPAMVDLLRQEVLSQLDFLKDIDPKTLEGISEEGIIRGQDLLYRHIQDLYDGRIPAIDGEKQEIDPYRGILIGKRDQTEARNLIELAQDSDARIVHVGGCMHNLTDSKGETLYSRLVSLSPSRKTLFTYEK